MQWLLQPPMGMHVCRWGLLLQVCYSVKCTLSMPSSVLHADADKHACLLPASAAVGLLQLDMHAVHAHLGPTWILSPPPT